MNKPINEKWRCPYLGKETDADFRRLCLRAVPREEKTNVGDPWTRLHRTLTVSAAFRRYGKQPETNSLDLWLHSTCNQFTDWPIKKEEAIRQLWTNQHRCSCKPEPEIVERPFDHPLRMAPFCETPTNINYIKLAIECPHISQTNNGYSRNENGNYY